MTSVEETTYLIIGNSASGIGAAEAIREADKEGIITIVSDEPYPAYSRPLISEYLADGCPLERMLYRPADFYDKNNIRNILGKEAVGLDLNEHTVEMEDGGRLKWRKLLLATGGKPIIPEIAGIGLEGTFTFTTLDDARAIDRFLNQYRGKARAMVIGGGLIGVSATEALAKRGVEVTIVEMQERILSTILDEEAAAMEEKALEEAGVEIIAGRTAAEINGYLAGEVVGVTLDDGRPIPCEMVVVAIGVQPRTGLVSDSGIEINRGIVVDRYMATSSPDVYACGDAAEAYDFVYEENRVTPIWPNAYSGGRTAGLNMAGVPTEYRGGTSMNSMKYFGTNIVSAGMVVPPDDSYDVISTRDDNSYKKVVLRDGLIAGMIFTGDIERSGIIYNLMKDRVNVETFKERLVAADFGLTSLPEEIWRARLSAPPANPIEKPEAALLKE
jgi:NAD(P)H-nitrite reductase large subunit